MKKLTVQWVKPKRPLDAPTKKRDTWKAIGKDLATKARVIAGYEHYGRILYIEDEVTLINRAKALLKAERIGKGKQREG